MIERLNYYLMANSMADDLQLNKIIQCFRPKKVKRNTILLSKGEVCKDLYFINQGCLRTFYITEQGHEKTRYIALEGSVVSTLSSFIAQEPTIELVGALEDSELYSIPYADFYRLTREIPAWDRFYRKLLEHAYLYQNKKIESLMTLSARQRYTKLLLEKPHYIRRLSNKVLASYLDITQETLSRLKSN